MRLWIVIALLLPFMSTAEAGIKRIRGKDDKHCLVMAMYREARGATEQEQKLVARTIRNRGNNACEVVRRPGQFPWARNGLHYKPREQETWQKVMSVAEDFNRGNGPSGRCEEARYFTDRRSWPAQRRMIGGRVTCLFMTRSMVFYQVEPK